MLALTITTLREEAARFSAAESGYAEQSLFGITDGKAIGTYLEHKFRAFLRARFEFEEGSSASGIDFPGLAVDLKVTSIQEPQSYCTFKSAWQKVYGLGYALLGFIYEKCDDETNHTSKLNIVHTLFIEAERTADYLTTRGVRNILASSGSRDDLIDFMFERNLPIDDIQASDLADEILLNIPKQGFLTLSTVLQWRLHYSRAIERAGMEEGVTNLYTARDC